MSAELAITEEVRALSRLDLHGLRAEWRTRFGRPPKLRSPEFLRLMLAWRMQAAVLGGLDAETRRRLKAGGAVRPTLRDGVRITKEWEGRTYLVDRVDGCFRWEGRDFPSLSAIAFAITGVKRNGPKFFGLREEGP